jgi:hypothetical protein
VPREVRAKLKTVASSPPLKDDDIFESIASHLESTCVTGHEGKTSVILPCGHIICSECEKMTSARQVKNNQGTILSVHTACLLCNEPYKEALVIKVAPKSDGYAE